MIYSCLSPIQINILDLKKDLIQDFTDKIKNNKSIRDYREDIVRIDSIQNFKTLNENYFPNEPRCNFKVYEVDKNLEFTIRSRFDHLSSLLEKSYVRYQLVSGNGILLPHKDEIRKAGIVILLTGEGGISEFFTGDQDCIFPDYRTMKLAHSCVMHIGENWIYNHQAIHSLRENIPPRIAVSFGWNDVTAQELYEYYKK
jgi:hypothetical protein